MTLTERCEVMLPNHTQCPNDAEEGSKRCLLHNKTAGEVVEPSVTTDRTKEIV